MDDTKPERLTLHEVAEILDVHYMTAYRYVRLGILPAEREGRSWRIRRDDLDVFMTKDEPRTQRGEADWGDRFFNRVLAADEAGAWGVLEAAFSSGMTIPEAYPSLLSPTMRRIGEHHVYCALYSCTTSSMTSRSTPAEARICGLSPPA